jgi:GlpG protein
MKSRFAFALGTMWPRLTVLACGLSALAFLGLNLLGENASWNEYAKFGYFPPTDVWEGRPWVLLTSVFVHFEIWHIAFNVYWLWILGNRLEEYMGSLRWLLLFISAAWVSSSLQLLGSGGMGVGMSGVGYALFGFIWVARSKIPSFREALSDQDIKLWLIWTVACIIATEVGLMNIGNAAHVSGLAFGAAVAAIFVLRYRLPLTVPALLLLIVASFVTFWWCPLSPVWNSQQAVAAHEREDYDAAIAL